MTNLTLHPNVSFFASGSTVVTNIEIGCFVGYKVQIKMCTVKCGRWSADIVVSGYKRPTSSREGACANLSYLLLLLLPTDTTTTTTTTTTTNLFIKELPLSFNQSPQCDSFTLPNGTKLNCLLYADDLVILSRSKQGLKNCLQKLEIFNSKWLLEVNHKKLKS